MTFTHFTKGVCVTFALLCAGSIAAQVAGNTHREVGHLLDYVARPDCQFNRNGTWYRGDKARQHLQQKYDYLVKRDLAPTAEAFIERAATASSMSGKAYQVRCGSGAPAPSGPWLAEELRRYRAGGAAPK
jgi:hypothetical protein